MFLLTEAGTMRGLLGSADGAARGLAGAFGFRVLVLVAMINP